MKEKNNLKKKFREIPVKKGDVVKLGAISIGSNGDVVFNKEGYILFLKNPKKKSIRIGEQIKLKIVKLFPKLGYAELYEI